MDRIYFDHNASTPLDPLVLEAMMPYLTSRYGNASSVHALGREVHKAVEDAREQVAALVGGQPREVVFTAGGTEANNLAICGLAAAYRGPRRKLVTSTVEHSSVAKPCKALAARGFELVNLPVKSDGRADPAAFREAIGDDTLLVSLMLANNETGAIQPVAQIARLARERGAWVHCDAVQGPGKLPLSVQELGVDLLGLGGHKFYGPHGIGALWIRSGVELERVLHGADHERSLRPGTHNTPGIVGLGAAARLALERTGDDARRLRQMVADLERRLLAEIPDSAVNGPRLAERLPNTLNYRVDGVEGENLLLALDAAGIAISAGSACHAGGVEPSPVLLAMGLGRAAALSSVRISLGRTSTPAQVERFVETLAGIVSRERARGPRQD